MSYKTSYSHVYVFPGLRNSSTRKRLAEFSGGRPFTRAGGALPTTSPKEHTTAANPPPKITMAHDLDQTEEPLLKKTTFARKKAAYIRACFTRYYQDNKQFHSMHAAYKKWIQQHKLEARIRRELRWRQSKKGRQETFQTKFRKEQITALVQDVGAKLRREKIAKYKGPEYYQRLSQHVALLKKERTSQATRRSLLTHHRYFNELMRHLGKSPVPTAEKAILLVADMQLHKYSTRYITRAVYSLQRHPRADVRAKFITRSEGVKNAIENLKGAQIVTEDTRIPMTTEMVREFCSIADRDFALKMAITMKAILWIGTNCMLCKGEMAGKASDPAVISRKNFQLHDKKDGMTITFHGWKMKRFRRSIPFDFIGETEKEAYTDIKNYLKIRDNSKTESKALFIDNREKQMTRYILEPLLYHLVDHRSYAGLNVTLHSMRIGGATIRHKQNTEIKEIMRMGRWTDITVNSYIRPELLLPAETLLQNSDFHTKRSYRMHLLCPTSCSSASEEQLATKNFLSGHTKTWEELQSMPDGQKLRLLEFRQYKMERKKRYERTNIPQRMKDVKRILLCDYACPAMEEPGITSADHIAKHYKGSQSWFNLTVHIVNRRWRGFINTCTYQNKLHKSSARAHATRNKTVRSNVQMITEADKAKARAMLDEYKVYRKEVPAKLKAKWNSIEPYVMPHHRMPCHWYPTETELEAEKLWHGGKKQEAYELMKQQMLNSQK